MYITAADCQQIARTAETDARSLEKPRVALTEVIIAHGCTKAR